MSEYGDSLDLEPLEPTIQNILDQKTLKWVFVGGKGGVGKTTTSSSLAIQLSKVRRNVLLLSTDPAHNLSDAFCQKFSKEPTKVNGFDNLFVMEVDTELDPSAAANVPEMFSEIMGAIPGIDEVLSFSEVMKLVQKMDYDVVVFDTAPTGHTLRLLSFPTVVEKALNKIIELKNSYGGMISQALAMTGGAIDEAAITDKLNELKEVVDEVIVQFKDPDLTTFVCVCIAEFLSLYETERLVQELTKFEIDTHNVVVNQLVTPQTDSNCSLCQTRVGIQQKYLSQIDELYEDFNVTKIPLMNKEVRGVDNLLTYGDKLLHPSFHND